MKKLDITFLIIGLFLGWLSYFAIDKILFSVIIFAIFLFDYFFFIRKRFVNFYSQIERVHTAYHFINSFIITLSVKESYDDAFTNASRINNKKLNDETENLTNLTTCDKVKYLRGYFNLSIYKMFLNILDLYQDQGGNILNMSDNLISECTRTEKTLTETVNIGRKHLIEFIILWIMSFGILFVLKFSIKSFYNMMLNNALIPPMLLGYFLLSILSVHLFINSYTNLTIKEDSGT